MKKQLSVCRISLICTSLPLSATKSLSNGGCQLAGLQLIYLSTHYFSSHTGVCGCCCKSLPSPEGRLFMIEQKQAPFNDKWIWSFTKENTGGYKMVFECKIEDRYFASLNSTTAWSFFTVNYMINTQMGDKWKEVSYWGVSGLWTTTTASVTDQTNLWSCTCWMNTILPEDIPLLGVLMILV